MVILKINGLAVGLSGVRQDLVDQLVQIYNENVTPIVYTQGSLGASGDLAPLAHLTLALMGLGAVHWERNRWNADIVLDKIGLSPLRLKPKEGLALINGTQFMSAYAVHALLRIQALLKTADIAAAMTLEAGRGSAAPFDERIHLARPHSGQRETAENLRRLLADSEILPSHRNCPKVQDPLFAPLHPTGAWGSQGCSGPRAPDSGD